MIIIWDKENIDKVKDNHREMWFDVYNNGIFEDRGYDITKMDVEDIDELFKEFKLDYFNYLDSLKTDESFLYYIILQDDYGKFISQARVIYRENKYYIEGLETHRDFMKKGFGSYLILQLEKEAKKRELSSLYANCYVENIPSIRTLKRCGYYEEGTVTETRICLKKDLV